MIAWWTLIRRVIVAGSFFSRRKSSSHESIAIHGDLHGNCNLVGIRAQIAGVTVTVVFLDSTTFIDACGGVFQLSATISRTHSLPSCFVGSVSAISGIMLSHPNSSIARSIIKNSEPTIANSTVTAPHRLRTDFSRNRPACCRRDPL